MQKGNTKLKYNLSVDIECSQLRWKHPACDSAVVAVVAVAHSTQQNFITAYCKR